MERPEGRSLVVGEALQLDLQVGYDVQGLLDGGQLPGAQYPPRESGYLHSLLVGAVPVLHLGDVDPEEASDPQAEALKALLAQGLGGQVVEGVPPPGGLHDEAEGVAQDGLVPDIELPGRPPQCEAPV